MEVVAPSSAPMLVMVARSGTVSVATPSPPYSMILPTPPFTVSSAQNLQDDVLCAKPRGESLPVRLIAHHFRHGDVIRAAAHGHGDVQPARAHRQHADAAARGGVAVGADQRLARNAKTLQMHLMADAVART